ncbi:pimeloyl-ACP methyl ester carboxylesterase [Pseudonocardia sediminis]|uniref:Pimeloyl-ACP methyl ester carboxylesterase n=1 Tax=Pseudonocardia sediminis TaxID=1397368 RepID=A0A4Q7V4N6_PSEST|nr:alpha/beta hydrolase [Pseudonocardia sediminis]RZT87713.1 pimeloyl-ACP methyl ester carboxylesterase [Pseudonocardia sediminis]
MSEDFTTVGDIRICHESFGSPEDPMVVLVMGLGLSLDWWREGFCRALAGRGFHVVRFDNRDVGRSTHVRGPGISAWGFVTRRATPVYTLGDMADDVGGLIAALDPRGAHVVGASLGSMVAQEVAIRHPSLTLSLTSIMGRPGDGRTGKVSWRMVPEFLRPPSSDPVESMVASFRRIGSEGRTAADDEDVRVTMRRSSARETGDGTGGGRQLAACVGERDRTADLGRLTCPALVFHGLADRVIQPSGGRATAAAIPAAELVEVPGMGHDLPQRIWPDLIEAIHRTADRATRPAAG